MKAVTIFFAVAVSLMLWGCDMQRSTDTEQKNQEYKQLSAEEKYVIVDKGTERPFTGKYHDFFEKGTYVCKRCGAPLYRSDAKFSSSCGWPSFDDEIEGAVKRITDRDGMRTEIVCANCGAHLGHVFIGEGFTPKNVRHCVNSVSMDFVPAATAQTKKAYFAGGCFWGVEYYFEKEPGVIEARSGYMGGKTENPSYEEVSYMHTGHVETVEVEYDPSKTSFEKLARLFFEIHDPTQKDGQGPDIGKQYRSVVFYNDEEEKTVTEKLIELLRSKGYDVATQVRKVEPFWEAEEYHQDYYEKHHKMPYCHGYTKRF
jgi:peptide methionine sulfoxide reductase msrA/msrB